MQKKQVDKIETNQKRGMTEVSRNNNHERLFSKVVSKLNDRVDPRLMPYLSMLKRHS